MDDDTSFVVGIIIIICICAVIGYGVYNYFTSVNPQIPEIFGFKNNAPFTHAVLIPTSSSELTRTPHLRPHNTVVMNVSPITG